MTFSAEVTLFWSKSMRTQGAILFYLNRYLVLLGNIPTFIFFFWPGPLLRHNVRSRKRLPIYRFESANRFPYAQRFGTIYTPSDFLLLLSYCHTDATA